MMKLVINHLVHRCKTTKTLLIVYVVFIITFFMMMSLNRDLTYVTDREQILNLMSMADTLLAFVLIVPVIFVLIAVKMYMDYKQGDIRWALLTKYKYSYVIGDIVFLLSSILLLYVLYYVLLRYGVSARMAQFDKKVMLSYGFQDASFFMARMDIMKLLFPHTLVAIVCNFMKIVVECTLCCCAIRYLIKGKKYFMDLFILVIGLILVLRLGSLLNEVLQNLVYAGMSVFYYRATCMTWSVVKRRDGYVEN